MVPSPSQAGICKFNIRCQRCDHDVGYTDQILRDIITRNIADGDIQLELLGNENQDMSLEEVLRFIEAKEAGKRSASHLLERQTVEATRSSTYRKFHNRKSLTDDNICNYCGKRGHGKQAPSHIRKQSCTAYGKTCKHCGKENYFETMCRSKDRLKKTGPTTDTSDNAVFDALCTVSSVPNNYNSNNPIMLDHHIYDQLSGTWVNRRSHPQPFIQLTAQAIPEDFQSFGFPLNTRPKPASISAMADTGCQSCLAGIKVMHQLGLRHSDLIPVSMQMHAANNQGINILGAMILRLTGQNKHGDPIETRQLTYVTDNSNKFFISKEACIALGIVSKKFPDIGEATDAVESKGEDPDNPSTGPALANPCHCPKRQLPPQRPQQLPFPATSANRGKLKEFLLDFYKSSTFNTCDHQPLP